MSAAEQRKPIDCAWRLTTSRARGAIAIFQLTGDVEAGFESLGLPALAIGAMATGMLCGVDQGVAVRTGARSALLMPHGGPAIVDALATALSDRGLAPADGGAIEDAFPEGADAFEALTLRALAEASSPLAIDLLLDQPRRWREWDGASPDRRVIQDRSMSLRHLLSPPLVVAVGGANVGKSTLVNSLARRRVSIVADEPGTTRDHVGVTLDLAGLTVRWVDSPGWRSGAGNIEREALRLAREVAARADLVLLCGDGIEGPPAARDVGAESDQPMLRVATRADLGVMGHYDVITAAAPADGGAPRGLKELVAATRELLCPASALAWAGPWAFDDRLFDHAPAGA